MNDVMLAAQGIEVVLVVGAFLLFIALACLIDMSIALRRIDKKMTVIVQALEPAAPPKNEEAERLTIVVSQDDGLGRVLHAASGQTPFHTEYRSEGYFWQRLTGAPIGPFATRELAKESELSNSTKRRS